MRECTAAALTSAQVLSMCQGVRQDAQDRVLHSLHWTCGYPGAEGSRSPLAEQVGERQVKSSASVFQDSKEAMLYSSSFEAGK